MTEKHEWQATMMEFGKRVFEFAATGSLLLAIGMGDAHGQDAGHKTKTGDGRDGDFHGKDRGSRHRTSARST